MISIFPMAAADPQTRDTRDVAYDFGAAFDVDVTRPLARVIIVGLGNIGSFLVALVGRIAEVGSVTLVDHDLFSEGNRFGQDCPPRAMGRPKARVMGAYLKHLRPALEVRAIVSAIEDVPSGLLRHSIIIGALDNRLARLYLGRLSFRLGVPYVDGGVQADGRLARVSVFVPGPTGSCIECSWGSADYEALPQRVACDGVPASAPAPTGAPASLGAIDAAYLATQVEMLVRGDTEHLLASKEVLLDTKHHRLCVTTTRRNRRCRNPHHVWSIESTGRTPGEISLAAAFALALPGAADVPAASLKDRVRGTALSLRLEDKAFVLMMECRECGRRKRVLRLEHRLAPGDRRCPGCRRMAMIPVPSETLHALESRSVPPAFLDRSLYALGFREDVFTVVTAAGERHFDLDGATPPRRRECDAA
jgi:molybdopterin/thiamine biosynthesis adenylyltransferase